MSWVLAFVGFSLLVLLHELGHFAAAKAVGMRVERFSLFFGPLLVKVRRGDTEYGIGPIPLGGYVKITGMDPREELPAEIADRAYYRQPPWKRIVVIAAGPLVNIVLAVVVMTGFFVLHGKEAPVPVVQQVSAGSPAAASPLRAGDRILAIDGHRTRPVVGATPDARARASSDQVVALGRVIRDRPCRGGSTAVGCAARKPARVVYARDGRRRTTAITPRMSVADGDRAMRLGVLWATPGFPYALGAGAHEAVRSLWTVTTKTVQTLSRLFTSAEARRQVSGPVGSYDATRQTFELSVPRAIALLAVISLSLGIFNLLPFLPLDGGHIFWALAEKVRGQPLPFAWLEKASIIGVLLVVAVFALGLTNDIGRIAGSGIQVR